MQHASCIRRITNELHIMSYMLVVVGDIDEIATTMPITLRPYSGGKLNAQRNACERKKRE